MKLNTEFRIESRLNLSRTTSAIERHEPKIEVKFSINGKKLLMIDEIEQALLKYGYILIDDYTREYYKDRRRCWYNEKLEKKKNKMEKHFDKIRKKLQKQIDEEG